MRISHSIEPLEPRTLLASAVGPDTYGYVANLTSVGLIHLTPGDPNVTTLLNNTDDGTAPVNLGANTFNFYGQLYSGPNDLFVSENGLLTFDTPERAFKPGDLTADVSQAAIAPLWDDWRTVRKFPGTVTSELDTTGGNDRLIVQWNTYHFPHSPTPVTFQAILQLNTGDQPGDITFNYPDIYTGDPASTDGSSATVGIKDAGVQDGHRLLISQAGSSSLVANTHAILISNIITQRPHAVITIPQNVEEGETILDASASTDPTQPAPDLNYAWDFNGDGKYGETGENATFGDEVGINPTFSTPALANDTIFPISLRVTDSAGLISYAFANINVHHVPLQPTITAPHDILATVPTTFTLSTAPDDSSFIYNIDWGDDPFDRGSISAVAGSPIPAAHTYAQPGTYTITLTATNKINVVSSPVTLHVTVAARPAKMLTDSGVLVITANNAQNDITLDESNGDLNLNLNSVATTYSAADVKSIDIQALDGTALIDANVDIPQSITTGDGDDTITTGAAADTINSGNGNDSITSNGGGDSITGSIGNKTIDTGDGYATVQLLGGNNFITAQSAMISTGDGNDTIIGGDGGLNIAAGNGNDSITTGAGNDVIIDGNGNDFISSGDGKDTVSVYGDSTTSTGATIDGGAGDDTIGGYDISGPVTGGDGNDTIRINSDADHPALVYGGDGNDKIFTTDGRDTLYGGPGRDFLYGGNGNDFLSGGAGSDHLFGQGGNDRLFGDAGYDHLNGQGGNDTLSGGPNADHLNGGVGDNSTPHDDPLDALMNIQTD